MNLFILSQSPYSSSLAREALDMALAFAAFDQEVALLFTGDAVYQLYEQQDSSNHGLRNISKTLDSLTLFDINQIYVCENSLAKRAPSKPNLKSFASNTINKQAISQLISNSTRVFNF